jgi:Na+-transporting NADH:ubiquinone oxidoreductase subunit NqrB
MEIIVGMDQCIVDVSRSDFILMIGRQLLVLAMILFLIFFGTVPISSPLNKYASFFQEKNEPRVQLSNVKKT